MSELLLGIDAGTTNVKAVLTTPTGRVVAQAQNAYPTQHPRPGRAEQNPQDWWKGLVGAVREVLATSAVRPERITGIGVSGQGCAVTLIDRNGEVLRPAIIWMDSRSERQCENLRACCAEEILQRNGKSPAPYNADPVLMWLQEHEPETLGRAACSLTTTGYINFRLTGEPVLNVSDASILFAFDLQTGGWSDSLIHAFDLPRRLYPPVAQSREIIGALHKEAAAALGLCPGTKVVAGGEDTSSAGLAIGVVRPGQVLLSLGTAGTLYAVQDQMTVHPKLLTFLHVLEGQFLLGGSVAAVGAALAWCRDAFGGGLEPAALLNLAAESEAGAGGLLFLPYLSGELQPINDGHARGVFVGISPSTETKHLVRAVLEGTAFALAHNLRVATRAGAKADELRAVGGPTRSPFWCQLIADVTNKPLKVLGDNPGAPLGNALLAADGVGLIDSAERVAEEGAVVSRTFEPRAELRECYDGLFEIYKNLYPNLKGAFADLAALSGSGR